MAAVEKRTTSNGKTSYRVKVRIKGFPPETASFVRLTDAREWGRKTESDMKAGRHFGQSKRHTFNELADDYLAQAKDIERLDYWRDAFGADTLDTITPARIARERDRLLAEHTPRFATPETGDPKLDAKREKAKRKGSTVNRYLAALSSCLGHAVKTLQWLERNPRERITKPAESQGRVRFLSDDEKDRLLAACRPHPDLYLAVVLTSLRQLRLPAS